MGVESQSRFSIIENLTALKISTIDEVQRLTNERVSLETNFNRMKEDTEREIKRREVDMRASQTQIDGKLKAANEKLAELKTGIEAIQKISDDKKA